MHAHLQMWMSASVFMLAIFNPRGSTYNLISQYRNSCNSAQCTVHIVQNFVRTPSYALCTFGVGSYPRRSPLPSIAMVPVWHTTMGSPGAFSKVI